MDKFKVLNGKLLISDPSIINDSSFNRSIILITEHTVKNSVGFIINKPLNFTIQDLIPDIKSDLMIYKGGPVEQDNLYFIHKVPNLIPDSISITEDIFWGGNFTKLRELLNNNLIKKNEIRFFLGYSGWGENQLLGEISNNSWFVSENDFKDIFSENEKDLWRNKIIQKGGEYKLWVNTPEDISLN